eukprot:9135826-Alexandrium_andersonii.AAC.1
MECKPSRASEATQVRGASHREATHKAERSQAACGRESSAPRHGSACRTDGVEVREHARPRTAH